MKKLCSLLAVGAVLSLAACGGDNGKSDDVGPLALAEPETVMPDLFDFAEAAPPPPDGQAPATAGALPKAEFPEDSEERTPTEDDIAILNYAVYMYKEEFGHYPASLERMVGTAHLRSVPMLPAGQRLNYDPQSGSVTLAQ